jgi:hypothetical protein
MLFQICDENETVTWGLDESANLHSRQHEEFCALSWTLKLPAEICFSGVGLHLNAGNLSSLCTLIPDESTSCGTAKIVSELVYLGQAPH